MGRIVPAEGDECSFTVLCLIYRRACEANVCSIWQSSHQVIAQFPAGGSVSLIHHNENITPEVDVCRNAFKLMYHGDNQTPPVA